MFARKHYESIAYAMQNTHPGDDETAIDYEARLDMWRDIRDELAITFARDNARFTPERFKAACQPQANVKLRTHYQVAP